jgi:hypothetical protein
MTGIPAERYGERPEMQRSPHPRRPQNTLVTGDV